MVRDMHGLALYGADLSTSMALGYCDTEVLDATAGDAAPSATFVNCRFISVDKTGIIKIDYTKPVDGVTVTETKQVTQGVIYAIRNVTKVYANYTGQTAITGQVYDSTGVLVNGVKIHR